MQHAGPFLRELHGADLASPRTCKQFKIFFGTLTNELIYTFLSMQRSANFDPERSELSLNGFRVEFTDWEGIFESGKAATRTNKRRALLLPEVELEG